MFLIKFKPSFGLDSSKKWTECVAYWDYLLSVVFTTFGLLVFGESLRLTDFAPPPSAAGKKASEFHLADHKRVRARERWAAGAMQTPDPERLADRLALVASSWASAGRCRRRWTEAGRVGRRSWCARPDRPLRYWRREFRLSNMKKNACQITIKTKLTIKIFVLTTEVMETLFLVELKAKVM